MWVDVVGDEIVPFWMIEQGWLGCIGGDCLEHVVEDDVILW